MHKYAAALICLLIGCAAGSAMPTITAQTLGSNPSAPRWEQFCDFEVRPSGSRRMPEYFNRTLARRGQEGWEYVGHITVHENPCFRRPAAR
jgi:hypothetical protein